MDYEKKYKEALERAKYYREGIPDRKLENGENILDYIFPELKESEDERIRKALINVFSTHQGYEVFFGASVEDILAWLEKQGEKANIHQDTEDDLRRQSTIQVLEYARSLDAYNQYGKESINKDIAWLEKQGQEPKKVSIWKHWKNGIAGNGDGEQIYLIKYGNTYHLSSCLSFECDYIELSELDNLMSEKQDEQPYWKPNEEQLQTLHAQLNEGAVTYPEDKRILFTLYEDLMKIMTQEEKQGEQKSTKNIMNVWKDMRLEVYQQASGNRHEPNYSDDTTKMFSLNDIDEIIEKMSEQKTADKIEPKFKIGDWIINNDKRIAAPTQILKIEKYGYVTSSGYISFDKVKTDYHLWTIQDAKDGDVLRGYPTDDYPWIGIFHELNDDYTFKSYCFLQAGITGKFCPPSGANIFNRRNVDGHNSKVMVPATKEERDFLFKKMKEAGYEWDAEKKELKEIEQKPTERSLPYEKNETAEKLIALAECLEMDGDCLFNGLSGDDYGKLLRVLAIELTEVKPAWGEEDEKMFNSALWHVKNSCGNGGKNSGEFEVYNWLKSLKDRMKGE